MASDPLLSSCQSILNQVRKTNLNFSLQETPFSIYLTVRKSFVKSRIVLDNPVNHVDKDSEYLKSKLALLQIEHEKLKGSLRESLEENETKTSIISNLEKKIGDLRTEIGWKDDVLDSVESKIIDTNRALQVKHEKVCAVNKNLKYENEDLKKETNNLNIATKTAKKEGKEAS